MKIVGRGATINPASRFEKLEVEYEPDPDAQRPRTVFLRDDSQSIISTNDSPDIGFDASINPYRGCEHGCAYCYARPTHEYLGFSAGLDFETKIVVKANAAALLRKELSARNWVPKVLAMSGVTDCYQPVERSLQITRSCLEVLAEFRNPVGIVTKNHLVTRDIDILSEMAKYGASCVYLSITSLDNALSSRLEPRGALAPHRLDAIKQISAAGVPVGVLIAPVIPGLTDHEVPAILEAARDAGASWAGYTMLRLPYGVKDIFSAWLDEHFPAAKGKILERVRSLRGGKLNDSDFGSRMKGEGFWAGQIEQLFKVSRSRLGYPKARFELSTASFRNMQDTQLQLFNS